MKKSYFWQILLLLFALYLILLAFFPGLHLLFDYIRISLFLAIIFLWLGVERKHTLLFFIGLAFSALYVRDILPYWYSRFNIAPLFWGLLVMGIALHSIQRKQKRQKLLQFQGTPQATITSNDADYITINATLKESYEYSTTNHLQAVSIQASCSTVQLDLSQAQFEKDITYLYLKNTLSSCHIRLPRHVKVVNTLKSNLGELSIAQPPQGTSHQLYLTGTNTLSNLVIHYV